MFRICSVMDARIFDTDSILDISIDIVVEIKFCGFLDNCKEINFIIVEHFA